MGLFIAIPRYHCTMRHIFIYWFLIMGSIAGNGQNDTLEYTDKIYVDYIKSVAFHPVNSPIDQPILNLGSRTGLHLSFDDVGGDNYQYNYEIIHCDKDWNPSDIGESEYLTGINGRRIEDVIPSVNTLVDYFNYKLTIPNNEVSWTLSGNYLLVIRDEEDLPVISKRFMVVDSKVIVVSTMKKSFEEDRIFSDQNISFEIDYEGYQIQVPEEEIFVHILQNGRWGMSYKNLRPLPGGLNRLKFQRSQGFPFPGHKDFRSFDIRSFDFVTKYVHSIDLNTDETVVLLELTKPRAFKNYLSENDANGAFYIQNKDLMGPAQGNNDRLRVQYLHHADYAKVIFNLKTMEIEDKDVYILGNFNNWLPSDEYKLTYDHTRNIYVGETMFKQGYYDYFFGTVDESGFIDTEELEGNSHETENLYTFLVYHRNFGDRYDRLIGVSYENSRDTR